jgi:hypothetical protein
VNVPLSGSRGTPGVTGAAAEGRVRELAEIIQKLYLGVGVVISVDEARLLLSQAGMNLESDVPTDSITPLAGKTVEFFDRYARAIESRLGTVKALPIPEDVWQMERWVRDLAAVYSETLGSEEAWKAAAVVLSSHRFRLAQAFASGGLDAVRQVEAPAQLALQ